MDNIAAPQTEHATILTEEDAAFLWQARTILQRLADDAAMTSIGRDNRASFGYGMMAATAQDAADAIFRCLNVAKHRCDEDAGWELRELR